MIRLIGDVHGKYEQYLRIANQAEYSIQLGDMGFCYDHMYRLDDDKHRFIGGNHDNYDEIFTVPHALGNFGNYTVPSLGEFFFIRGSRSIDWRGRTPCKDFWLEEELSFKQMQQCAALYINILPKVVISHDCPAFIIPQFSRYTHYNNRPLFPSNTADFLEMLFGVHKPERWYFGHYHTSKACVVDGCQFQCIDELDYIDI